MLKEGMGIEEVRRMMTKITRNDLSKYKLWHSLKNDRGMIMPVQGDVDIRLFSKRNEEHMYFYMGESDGPKKRTQKAGASCAGRMQSCNHSVICVRSGRDRDVVGLRVVKEMADN